MKAVKSAAYEARKANRVAAKAHIIYLKSRLKYLEKKKAMTARMQGIGRDWKKKGRPAASTHLHRLWKAEMEYEQKHISSLESQLIALDLKIDAKDAEIAERDARLRRLTRLLRVAKGRSRTDTVDEE